MVDLLSLGLRFLHIAFAIMWIGAVLYGVGVLRVALPRAEADARKEVLRHLIPVAVHYVPMSAVMTILFGGLLYLYLGRFDPALLVGSLWGQLLLVSFVLTVGTFAFGLVVVIGAAKKLQTHLEEAVCDHDAAVGALQSRFNRGQVGVLVLGMVILGLMVYVTAALGGL